MIHALLVSVMLNCLGHMPFVMRSYSIHEEAKTTDFIAFVTFDNPATSVQDKVCKFSIKQVLKSPEPLKTLKTIEKTTPLGWAPDKNRALQFILFADFSSGKPDVFRLIEADQETANYVNGVIKAVSQETLLRYCFRYLQHANEAIAQDAHIVFSNAASHDLLTARSAYDPVKLRSWLAQKDLKPYRINLYAGLLGLTGNAGDANLLVALIKQRDQDPFIPLDGCLMGMILLDKDQGWKLAAEFMQPAKDFTTRFGVLRALQTLKEIGHLSSTDKDFRHLIDEGLKQEDMIDLYISGLRKWKIWDYSQKVVSHFQADQGPLLKRSIVQFALQSPDPNAKAFITKLRLTDPRMVEDCEEYLEYEMEKQQRNNPRK